MFMYTIISCGLTVAVVYYGLAMLACRQCKCHCHCLHATVLLLVHVIELHIATLPSMDRQTDAWERLSTLSQNDWCMLLLQLAGADPEFGSKLFFFLLSFLCSSLLLFLLFTMPKFIREGLVGLQWTTWGRGLEPPVPTLAPPLIDSSSVANSRLAYIVDMLCLLYLFVLTYIL